MPTVTSEDGTKIGYEYKGHGPAVILIDGATAFRAFGASPQLAQLLSAQFTAYYYDRRGRGESTDVQPFSLHREIEDIEALIEVAGGSAYVYGISSGAALALEAAIELKDKIKKLAIYEVPYDSSEDGIKKWKEYRNRLTKALGAGHRDEAITLFMQLVGMPDEMIKGMRHSPFWKTLETIAPTLEYDAAALGNERIPPDRAATIKAQTLIMDGGASLEDMPFMRTSANALTKIIPHAQHKILEGQRHDVDIKVLAPILIEFLNTDS